MKMQICIFEKLPLHENAHNSETVNPLVRVCVCVFVYVCVCVFNYVRCQNVRVFAFFFVFGA